MANLNDTPQWPDVYQLEQSDPVVGGAPNPATGAGMDNIPHMQLAQRTSWLRSAVEALQSLTAAATATVAGIVKLSGATNSTATDTAASSAAVKAANDNAETRALKTTIISAGGLATGGGDLSGSRTITVPVATQAQAEAAATTPAAADNTAAMTALRVAQFFAALGLPSVANLIAAVADTTAIRSIATGGTGGATAAAALTNLGLPTAASINAAVADTTAVRAIAQGGTGGSTAAAVLANMGLTATAAQINGGIFYTGTTAPSNPVEGSRWRDTSTPSAPLDRVYRLGAWVTELVDLGLTATAAQINPLGAAFDNAFLGAGATGNLAGGANDFGNTAFWPAATTDSGMTCTRTTGVDAMGPFALLRFTGVATGIYMGGAFYASGASRALGVTGEFFTGSVIVERVAQVGGGVTGMIVGVNTEIAPSTNVTGALSTASNAPTPTTLSASIALSGAANQARTYLLLQVTSGAAIDVTYRVRGLQFDKAASRLSYPFRALSASEARAAMGVDPAGEVGWFAMASAPAGWLKANGALVSRTAYAALFSAIGTTYGAGDGSTTFALPDLRGEFLRGWDDGRGVDSGRLFGSAQGFSTARPNGNSPQRLLPDGSTTTLHAATTNPSAVGFARVTKTGESATGSSIDAGNAGLEMDILNVVTGDAETRPRNIALLACIKF